VGTTKPLTALDIVGSASESGNLTFRGGGAQQVNLINGSSLGFYNSVGGDTGLAGASSPSLYIQSAGGAGYVGIGTTNMSLGETLTVNGSIRTLNSGYTVSDSFANHWEASQRYTSSLFGLNNFFRLKLGGADGTTDGYGISDYDTAMRFYVKRVGGVGINTVSPVGALDVQALNGITSFASLSGKTSFASLVVDNSGVGDLFAASSSGLSRFVITQAGNVGYRENIPRKNSAYCAILLFL
jgi:hypothetical protein